MTKRPPTLADIPSAPEWERPGLSAAGRRVAFAAIEAMLCDRNSEGRLVPPAAEWIEGLVHTYDRSIGNSSIQVRLAVRLLVLVLEWLPFLATKNKARMSRLALAPRVDYLEALEGHRFAPLTMLLVATKVPMLIAAFESGDALRITGSDRPTTFSRRRLPVASERSRKPAAAEAGPS